jgi:hypothetical protein
LCVQTKRILAILRILVAGRVTPSALIDYRPARCLRSCIRSMLRSRMPMN